MVSIKDDRGYNQGFSLVKSTEVRMRRRAKLILPEMNLSPDSMILEIGCGTGEVSFWIAEQTPARVLGADLCVPFIECAKSNFQRENLAYDVLDFNNIGSFEGKRFDYVIGNGILHHLYVHLDNALGNMKRLLNDRGKIMFLEPNFYNPYTYIYLIFTQSFLRKIANLEPDEMAFSRRLIVEKLERSAYGNIQVDYKDFLVPGVPDFMIQPSIVVGSLLEKIPLLRNVAQSLFIRAEKKLNRTRP